MGRYWQQSFLKATIAVATGFLPAAICPAFAQAGGPSAGGGLPHDWSFRHLPVANPDTRDEAARKGTLAFAEWKEKLKDPRFAAQVARKTRFLTAPKGKAFSPAQLQRARKLRRKSPAAGPPIHRDWSVGLNSGANAAEGYGNPGVFPAKFGFDVNAAPSCANDFVVFPTSGLGAVASATGSFSNKATAGDTVTITNTNTGQSIVLTACTGSSPCNTLLTFKTGNSASVSANNLTNAISRNGTTVGVTAVVSSANVTVTAVDAGTGRNNIALADTSANFSWGTATLTGGTAPPATRPTIVGFNNLYNTTCSPAVPGTYWAFNTGAAFTETSPVLSLDGTQVAFTQRGGSHGQASLVLLKWNGGSGTIASPATPTSVTAANYLSCAKPCMLVLPFKNGAGNNNASPWNSDTNSSPFVDYSNDTLYVGDDSGVLHKFTGIFAGTPTEAGSPWPVTVSAYNRLSSPVYDQASGNIFVGSAAGNVTSGGKLHRIDATTGALVASSAQLSAVSSAGINDAPIVDSQAGRVYAFASADPSNSDPNCTTAPCMSVFQFTTTFTDGNAGTAKSSVGRGVATATSKTSGLIYAGTFDNAYYMSADPANPTGYLYVCGDRSGNASRPVLWRIPVTGNTMGSAQEGPRLTGTAGADCSPVTEILNGANEYIYVSVTDWGNETPVNSPPCTGACIYAYNLTTMTWAPSGATDSGLAAPGGTSGIIVDNISSAAGASQIYYSTLTSPGNAVQASQAGLN